MKEKILNLRSQGKSYNEISKILGIGKSHISYYCGDNQTEKWNIRLKKYRSKNRLFKKIDSFKSSKNITEQKILKLRKKGKAYSEIMKELNVSKSMVCYYCGDNQKEKRKQRGRSYRNKSSLIPKLEKYKGRKIKIATRDFQRRSGGKLLTKSKKYDFNYKDVLEKFGEETICYLSGDKINIIEDKNYSLDHINSVNNGGNNSLDNLGICLTIVNKMKSDLSVNDFLYWCEKILKYNGYEVKKINKEA